MTFKKDGIARGSAVFVSLADERENQLVLKEKAAAMYSFDKGTSTQDYPSSLMGSIALLRQTYYDAQWYAKDDSKKEINISLDAWNKVQSLPQIFEAGDKLSALRADKVGDEFKMQYIIKGSGDEYQRIDDIKETHARFILPLKFPAPYDVEDPYDAALVSYTDMKHWEMAPLNPCAFEKNFISFALTTDGLKEKREFWKNLRKAIEYGLSEKTALIALTVTPAEMLGMQDKIGSLKKGMIANFLITSGNIFDEKNSIYENWVQGEQYVLKDMNATDVRGNYQLAITSANMKAEEEKKLSLLVKFYELKISGDADKPKTDITIHDTAKVSAELSVSGKLVSVNFTLKGDTGITRLSGNVQNDSPLTIKGKGQASDGHWINWIATMQSPFVEKKDSVKKETNRKYPSLEDVIYPFTAYGQSKKD